MKKSKTIILIVAALATILLTSCFGGEAKKREKGTPIESTKTAVESILEDRKGNKGKRFAITGYLNFSPGRTIYTNRPQTVYISLEPGKSSKFATIEMHWKENGHNSVFVREDKSSQTQEVLFYDHDGNPLTMDDKVTISFSVGEESTYLIKPRIDKIK